MKKKPGILICAIVVLTGLWFWRYTSLNAYYDSINTVVEKVYQVGEIVPFEDDYTSDQTTVDGYSIRVDGMEILEIDEFCQRTGMTTEDMIGAPDRVALVTITLFNAHNEEDTVTLLDFGLHGIDSVAGMNWSLLTALNPVLEGHYSVRIREGSQYQFVLPYNLRQNSFGSNTWNNMDGYEWFLRVTAWPTEKDIAIN